MLPSEYFDRNCKIGSSNTRRRELARRYEIGVGNIMWGNDFPHPEGTWPYTSEFLGEAFCDIPVDETEQILGLNAAEFYGFDVDALQPIADEIGPTPEDLGQTDAAGVRQVGRPARRRSPLAHRAARRCRSRRSLPHGDGRCWREGRAGHRRGAGHRSRHRARAGQGGRRRRGAGAQRRHRRAHRGRDRGARAATRIAVTGDVRMRADCEAAVAAAVERFGGVDVLVNNAQQVPTGPLDACTDDDMYAAWESGALAAFRLMQLCHPLMTARGGGAIVNLASGAGTEGLRRARARTRSPRRASARSRRWRCSSGASTTSGSTRSARGRAATTGTVSTTEQRAACSGATRCGASASPRPTSVASSCSSPATPGPYVTGQTIHVDGGNMAFR